MATYQLTNPGLENFSGSLQNLILENWTMREVLDALYPNLRYRAPFSLLFPPTALGQQFTDTRTGLLADKDDPITPPANTDIDSGLTPVSPPNIETFAVTLNKYANVLDTNLLTSTLSITNQVLKNAKDLGLNAGKSMDAVARHRLFAAYNAGNTYLTANASNTNTINVANVYGFDFLMVDGVPTAVSATNKIAITVGGTAVNVTTVQNASVDKDIDWAPGQLVLDANVTALVGVQVLAGSAPIQVDPNGTLSNPYLITASSYPTLDMLFDMVSQLGDDNVEPMEDMYYHLIMDPVAKAKLMQDDDFKLVFRGMGNEEVYTRGAFGAIGNLLFFETSRTPKDTRTVNSGSVMIRHMIALGSQVGIEARYADVERIFELARVDKGIISLDYNEETGVFHIIRSPIDRLGQVISQGWQFLGGHVITTDSLTLSSSRNYGRAVVGRWGTSR